VKNSEKSRETLRLVLLRLVFDTMRGHGVGKLRKAGAVRQSEQGKVVLRFGDFTLNLERRGLYRGPDRVHLTSKPLETLIFLVENRARIVEKQEFFDAIWKDTFVTEDNLVHAIREIRRVLSDNKEDPIYIQTVPRHGYRFIAEVTTDGDRPNSSDVAAAPVQSQSVAQKNARWLLLVAPALFLIPIVVWFVWLRDRNSPASRVISTAPSGGIKNQITSGEFFSGKPAFSRDGKFILYVSSDEDIRGNGDLFIRQFPEGNAQRITNKINPSGDLPVFTSDGSHVVFSLPRFAQDGSRHHDLWMVPSFGGPPTRFIEDASGAGFSPDQKWVAYTKYLASGHALWVSPVANLNDYHVVATPGYTPRWAPNGEWLAYSTGDPNEGAGNLRACKVSSSTENNFQASNDSQLTQGSESIYGLTWTADSREVIFASKRSGAAQLYKVSIADGLVTPILTGIGEYIAPSASSDGSTLAFQFFRLTNDLMISSIDAHSTGTNNEPKNITFDEFHSSPRISPSGEKLVSVVKKVDNDERLYLTDLTTRERSQLADRSPRHPCWLNDVEIAFLSESGNANTEVVAVNIVTRELRSLTTFSGRADWLAVHPEGKKLAVVVTGTDHTERIVLRNLVDQTDSIIQQGAEYEHLRWSPDGSALAWNRPGPSINAPVISGGIWIIEVGKSEPRMLINEGYCPVWNADGTAIYFSIRKGNQGLWRYDLDKRARQLIRNWETVFNYDVVGRRLIFAHHKTNSQIYSIAMNK
jgi:Tol biopolymer transport system component/DNA-binding winged helix-turn-helix (wHTH) protein